MCACKCVRLYHPRGAGDVSVVCFCDTFYSMSQINFNFAVLGHCKYVRYLAMEER